MRIFVAGGAGYIGSVTTKLLLEENYEVFVYDNLVKGHKKAIPKGAVFIKGDLLDQEKLNKVFKKYRFSVVFHFASFIENELSFKRPHQFLKNNTEPIFNLLNVMLANRCEKIVISSSAAVYGLPEKIPLTEDCPLKPNSPYGESKKLLEEIIAGYARWCGIRYASLRYFNAGGAYKDLGEDHRPETHLIPLILKTALGQKKRFKIFGADYETRDGTCIRDYIHVYDLAKAHILAMKALEEGNKIYNLGSGKGFTVKEVLEKCQEVTGRKIPYEITGRRIGDIPVLIASAEKIKEELGWKTEMSDLETIIKTAWDWLREHPKGYGD
uniref:UDP-glucose 4-epimerase n=1 Tax=candidate division WOR-3 bacterium TaxID=2052148 RepID=A0A7C3UW10_UNCW3